VYKAAHEQHGDGTQTSRRTTSGCESSLAEYLRIARRREAVRGGVSGRGARSGLKCANPRHSSGGTAAKSARGCRHAPACAATSFFRSPMVSSSLRSGAATGQHAAATRCPSCALATHLHFTRIFLPCAGPRGNAPSRRLQQTRGEAAVLNASGAAAGKRTRRSFSTTSIIWLSAQRAPASRRACCDVIRTGGAPLADVNTSFSLFLTYSRTHVPERAFPPLLLRDGVPGAGLAAGVARVRWSNASARRRHAGSRRLLASELAVRAAAVRRRRRWLPQASTPAFRAGSGCSASGGSCP